MKRSGSYILGAICTLLFLIINPVTTSADSRMITLNPNVTFMSKFVFSDGTDVPSSFMTMESKIIRQPHYTDTNTGFMKYTKRSPIVLRGTKTIPNVGGGLWKDTYKSPSVTFGHSDSVTMEGFRDSYNSLFIDTKDSVKAIWTLQKVGVKTNQVWYQTQFGSNVPYPYEAYNLQQSFFNTTENGKYGYKLSEISNLDYPGQLCDPDDVLFASTAASTTKNYGSLTYSGSHYGEWIGNDDIYTGKPVTFRIDVPKIEETFVDMQGTKIPTSDLHPTFVQDNKYDALEDSYSFGGVQNGQATTLPQSYVANSKIYEYKGWYYGDSFKTTNPPKFDWKDISNSDKDKYAKIRIVYEEKKTMYDITARWVDDTSNANLIDCSAQIGLPNPGTVAQAEGTTFTFNIFGAFWDSSSAWWDIVGWRNMTDDPNTLHSGTNVSVPSVNKNTLLHFVYKKRAARLDVNLLPDSTVIKKSGETIDWTLTVKNTGHMYNVEKLDISHLITQTGGSMSAPTNTVIEDNNGSQITGITNNVWSDGGVELAAQNVKIKPNEKITVKFKTTVTGDIGDLLNLKTIVNSNNNTLSSSDDTNVRIKDPDHHEVTDPADSKLSLLYVPTIFGFGQQDKMNIGTTQTMTLAPGSYHSTTVSEGFYVKLQDPRNNQSGNNWKLSAKLDYFADSVNSTILATQPVLTMGNCSTEVVNNPETASENGAPTGDVTLNSPTVTLTGGGGTVPIMNSQNTKNKGTWIFRAPFNDIKLQIPADVGEAGRAYKSELIWALEDTI